VSADEKTSEPALRVSGAVKHFSATHALDGVSLTVEQGVYGLLGANGAGKSTLFRAILHLLELDAGSVFVDGLEVWRHSLEIRRRTTYLPEELSLYERLSAWELLEFVAGIRQLDNLSEREELLSYFDLMQHRHLLIGECSLGMRKKVGLCATLMGAPKLAILDEPLNGLDTESMRRLRLKIGELAALGTTFVISSHVMSFVERVCQRVGILRLGRLVVEGTPAELSLACGLGDVSFEDVFLHYALGPDAADP
jgi:ABC-2 type transport system ATP-binding protein